MRNIFAYDANEYWVVQTASVIPAGSRVTLKFEFTGLVIYDLHGCYKSSYISDITGEKR